MPGLPSLLTTFDKWAKEYGPQAEFIKVNGDEVPRIPTVFIVQGGKVVARFDCVPEEGEIARIVGASGSCEPRTEEPDGASTMQEERGGR